MADRATTQGVCSICRGPITPGHPVRGVGPHDVGRRAHASCTAAQLRSGSEHCRCGHARAGHSINEGGRCGESACVWFHI